MIQHQHIATINDSPFAQNKLSKNRDINLWAKQADLNWDVNASSLMFKDPVTQKLITDQNRKVLFRSDNQHCLGVVGKNFKPVSPRSILGFYGDLSKRLDINLEAAGHVKRGGLIWGLADLKEHFRIKGQDEIRSHLMFSTANDGTRSTNIFFISKRIICNNMLNFAFNDGNMSPFHIKIPHSKEVTQKRLDDIIEEIVCNRNTHWENFKREANLMSDVKMTISDASDYFANLLSVRGEDGEYYVPERNFKVIDKLSDVYLNGIGQDTRSAKNTVWGALNAVTRYVDHEVAYRNNETKIYASQFSIGKDLKNKAFRLAYDFAEAA